jgi:hypothetical protein
VDIKTTMMVEELRGLMPALRLVPELVNGSRPAVSSMSLPQQVLADVVYLLRSLQQRATLLEERCGRGWLPLQEIGTRFERLENAATINGNGADPLPELVRRIEALEASVVNTDKNTDAPGAELAAIVGRIEALEAAAIAADDSLRTVNRTVNGERQSGAELAALVLRIEALEQSVITPDQAPALGLKRSPDAQGAELLARLEALEEAIAAGIPSEAGDKQRQPDDSQGERVEVLERQLSEALARVEAREARSDPPALAASNAQRVAHGDGLRAAIAEVLQSDPGASGPVVLERLRATHAGKLPSVRTVRWHLQALRGKGNTEQAEGELAPETLAESQQ